MYIVGELIETTNVMQLNELESFKGKQNQRTLKWLQHVAHMGEIKMHQNFVGKHEGI
jgi:hypothetical protein